MYSASDFDYSLPESLIAQEPPVNRGDSRLLIVPPGDAALIDAGFGDLGSRLREGDLLVINDTKVLPARLFGHKTETGGKFELMSYLCYYNCICTKYLRNKVNKTKLSQGL